MPEGFLAYYYSLDRYKGRPDLTAMKFHKTKQHGEEVRVYRSGDRGFLQSDGRLSICGRISNREVKLRGFRIDLAELEKDILECDSRISMVSVQLQQDSLVAFVVPVSLDCVKIKERITQNVPSYSIPARIVAMDTLPINSNGKTDHDQVSLLSPFSPHVPETVQPDASQQLLSLSKLSAIDQLNPDIRSNTELRSIISRLWMDTLSLTSPPAENITFYEAGGHR